MDLNKLTRELWLLEDFSRENVMKIVYHNKPDYKYVRKALIGREEDEVVDRLSEVSIGVIIYALGKFESLERIFESDEGEIIPSDQCYPTLLAYYFFGTYGDNAKDMFDPTKENNLLEYMRKAYPHILVEDVVEALTTLPNPFIELPPMTIKEAIEMFPRPNHNKGE